jgi:hypothetical protein
MNLETLFPMSLSFSSAPLTLGMETFSFTFKPNAFRRTSLAKSADVYVTTLAVISSSATLYTTVVLTPFFGDV